LKAGEWFHLHAHSEYSVLDGMPKVHEMVQRVAKNGQPALALTDHGVLSGTFQLYRACLKAGIMPIPGQEFYVVPDLQNKTGRYHLGLLALDETGYRTLVRLSSLAHKRDRFHRKPRLDFGDLAELHEAGLTDHLVCTSGCYFGYPIQQLVTLGERACEQALTMLASWFGDTFLVELQHHGTDHGDGWTDQLVNEALVHLAELHGWPFVITQDAHYCDQQHKPLHDMMKLLAIHGADPGDVGFPGDSYHLADTAWVAQHYDEDVFERSLEGNRLVLECWQLDLPFLDRYQFHMPAVVETPHQSLTEAAEAGLRASGHWDTDGYLERLRSELSVIEDTGFASYFLLVGEMVTWARAQNILVMARGSANGSLVCWCLGITQADPLRWGLLFERFLTRDRSKPPDIDLDIEQERRADVVAWLSNRHEVDQIGTFTTLGIDDDGKGSVLQQFLGWARRNDPNFVSHYGKATDIHKLRQVDPDVARLLEKLSAMRVRKSAGAHAAGFVIGAPTLRHRDYVPTMLIPSSGSTVTQIPMDDLEDAGIIKVDLLGLRSLSTLKLVLELTKGSPGVPETEAVDLDWIPLDDPDVFKSLRSGDTTGVFQLEGFTARNGAKELAVKSIHDIILVMALYRTATIDSGYKDLFLARRGRKVPVVYPNEVFKKHMRRTYGVAVFQEQVISTMSDMGMDIETLNSILKAVKVKHSKHGRNATSERMFRQARAEFDQLCQPYGMSAESRELGWASVEGFAAYGFNRAHATAYGLLAYRMAWFRFHHPLEFWTAALATTAGSKKEVAYMRAARAAGIRLLKADVNVSGPVWTIDRQRRAIRKGLTTIDGIGRAVAEEVAQHAPYTDLADLQSRTAKRIVNASRIEKLRSGGALGSLH
jgi:DNA polymerase-3 subunit alpha